MKSIGGLALVLSTHVLGHAVAFAPPRSTSTYQSISSTPLLLEKAPIRPVASTSNTALSAVPESLDLNVVSLVAGQENYGLAIVALGEALWSFLQAPSFDHALKTFGPAGVAAIILVAVSGPMVTSGDASSVALGLEVATGVSVLLGLSYLARLLAPYSPSPKEIAFLGLLVSVAGFFSFSQNLVVDGFVTLPQLPSIPLPQLPTLDFGDWFNFDEAPAPPAAVEMPSAPSAAVEIPAAPPAVEPITSAVDAVTPTVESLAPAAE